MRQRKGTWAAGLCEGWERGRAGEGHGRRGEGARSCPRPARPAAWTQGPSAPAQPLTRVGQSNGLRPGRASPKPLDVLGALRCRVHVWSSPRRRGTPGPERTTAATFRHRASERLGRRGARDPPGDQDRLPLRVVCGYWLVARRGVEKRGHFRDDVQRSRENHHDGTAWGVGGDGEESVWVSAKVCM